MQIASNFVLFASLGIGEIGFISSCLHVQICYVRAIVVQN